jgi:hypothetical protein
LYFAVPLQSMCSSLVRKFKGTPSEGHRSTYSAVNFWDYIFYSGCMWWIHFGLSQTRDEHAAENCISDALPVSSDASLIWNILQKFVILVDSPSMNLVVHILLSISERKWGGWGRERNIYIKKSLAWYSWEKCIYWS